MQIYMAPMEGITTFPYRNAFHRCYGGIDKYFTPFLSSRRLNYKEINDILPEHNRGVRLVPQILSNQADVFLEIAAQLKDYGYQELNLNLGCPSGTVTAKKRGAGFLNVPDRLDAFLDEIFEKCPQEISVKTRIGFSSLQEWENLLSIFAKYPIKELIVHPRLAIEFYNGTPHTEAFSLATGTLSTPLCYNGDITSKTVLETLTDQIPSLDTVMLGRGALADPELPSAIKKKPSEEAGGLHNLKAAHNQKDMTTLKSFHDEILEGYLEYMSGEQPALFRMKELWTYMGRYLALTDRQMKQIHKTKRLADYRALISSFIV